MSARRRSSAPTTADLHRRWLELVETDGAFLAVPALKRVWPQGMPRVDDNARAALAEAKPAFEGAWERWDRRPNDPAVFDAYRTARDAWVDTVLRDVLGWGERLAQPPAGVVAHSPRRDITVTPTSALVLGGIVGALVLVVDPMPSVHDLVDDGWAASPIDRMEALLRAADAPIGVVTDGRWWAIVCARKEAMVASGVVDAQTWIEEPDSRDAFAALLSVRQLVGGRTEDRLPALFAESVAAAEEITEALGVQVRRAVELLVTALSEAAEDAVAEGNPDPLPAHRDSVYEAAVTVMMRVVFLLFAEERSLLPQGQLFTGGYGISGELDELDRRIEDESSEALDATHLVWHRLLATSQALFAGATFEDIRIPSYGGSLFDPARFEFLLARDERGALTVTVSDRVLREVLRAVQVAQLKGQPARRISFRDIDVEQIGYIYEGLLGYSCADVDEVTVGLGGAPGAEPEITLADLEGLAGAHDRPDRLADAILALVKQTQPAAKPQTKAAVAKALRTVAEIEDAERALLAVTRDPELRQRLRPFVGIIRRDLRNRPLVIQPGGLVLVETPSRATAGAHYTPRALAEDVVRYALEPLVFHPGPHQTADVDRWEPLSSDAILDLRVADVACGSGAFLVAAARYLAKRLVEAWHREGVAGGSTHTLEVNAIRQVVAKCLYGADINAMAVEMCKLSLWLVSLDPRLPFSFVDDKVLHGNSLLGVTSIEQLRTLHIDPERARGQLGLFELDTDSVLAQAVRLREALATPVDDVDPQRLVATKRRQWAEFQRVTAQLSRSADGVIAAGLRLGGKPGKQLDTAYEDLRIAVSDDAEGRPKMLDAIIEAGLTPTVPTDYEQWKPLHWALVVPDVLERGGFDAVVGNPPFLGGKKITGTAGTNVRDWLVSTIADGRRGHADLVAYFLLRAKALLRPTGTLGLIATNTVAQGDTREVGLDHLVADGFTITRAIQSRSWPAASANLEYAAVWGSIGQVAVDAERVSDSVVVQRISPLLEPAGQFDGMPVRLIENAQVAFIGSYVNGIGFTVPIDVAQQMCNVDPRSKAVIRPYLIGDDVNTSHAAVASRWVVDFTEVPEPELVSYRAAYDWVFANARPTRLALRNKPKQQARWWEYERPGRRLRQAIASLDDLLVIALVSKTVMPVRVPAEQVFSHMLGVFATDSYVDQAVLSSSLHQTWAITYGSTLETRVRYTPSDVFETFPRPAPTDHLHKIGHALDAERREIMTRRELGLTKLYNLVNDPAINDDADLDVARLRQIHVELDRAVAAAYGWDDVPLDHGFHTYRQMQRWTISPAARVELLDRLLELNHDRAERQNDTEVDEPEDGIVEDTDEGDDE